MKIYRFLVSPLFMGVLFIMFAVSMAVATFIENDFGSAAAYGMVYNTRWFELILLLLALNLAGQIIEFRLYRKEKLTVFLFHSAFLVMLIGAAITRYFGYEGSIHIREGEESNLCYSVDKYLGYSIMDEQGKQLASEMKKINLNSRDAKKYSRKVTAGGDEFEITLAEIIPNATESISEVQSGTPVISFMASTGFMGMENITLKKGGSSKVSGYTIGFDSKDSSDIKISCNQSRFYITAGFNFAESGMMHGDSILYPPDDSAELKTMRVYGFGELKIIPQQMTANGILRATAVDPAQEETGQDALIIHVFAGDKPASVTLWSKSNEFVNTGSISVNNKTVEIKYGSMITDLPFSLRLNDFILERYPGSDSPSGYKSDVVLIDRIKGTEKPFMIFMNNILKYRGFRFYQSSFDRDEKGTVLSVNHDRAGMLVTYTGYAIMMIFILFSIFNRKSSFRNAGPGYWNSPFRKTAAITAFMIMISGLSGLSAQQLVPDKKAAEELGRVLVQDQKGRTKPLFTLSNDILRKVTHENEFEGLSSMQVFAGVQFDFDNWQKVKMIRVSNSDIQKKIGVRGNMAAFDDIVDLSSGGGDYKLSDDVQKAYAKAPGERNKYDKELMKVDERVNIIYMIYTGQFMKMFPLKGNTHDWGTNQEALSSAISREDSAYLNNVIPLLEEAFKTSNAANAIQIAHSISDYQERFASYDLPSKSKIKTEVFYYKAKIFERLFPFYATVGIIMLIVLIVMVIRGSAKDSVYIRILGYLLFAGFVFHTVGLALRWYIAGHSPMSNGYESMLFISWVTLIAGLIFSRKSPFALSATAVLGSMTLMVAHLSFMDPEITNLVPVLKSYWLTLHVSVITGSYGFLGLGAILGLINMILLSFSTKKNLDKIGSTIEELTVINYRTLTLGLYFLTIGTFLGAVWANESWGRYWGWDPKETWSLITIVIYSFVVHSRMIPGLKDIYSFNLFSLFAFSSVLMTYFGVNYYLSGLHSYAAGDPVPVPGFVYIAVILLAAVSLMAYFRYSVWKREAEGLIK